MKRRFLIATLLTVGVLSSAACGTESDAAPPERHEVRMRDITYEPVSLKLHVGQPVSLMLRNEGSLVHDFSIQELPQDGLKTSGGMRSGGHAHEAQQLAVHLALEAGKSGEVRFTPTRAGTYTYYCTVPGHREAGIEGSLVVE